MAAEQPALPSTEAANGQHPPLPDSNPAVEDADDAPPPLPADFVEQLAGPSEAAPAEGGSSNEMAGLSEAEQDRLLKVSKSEPLDPVM